MVPNIILFANERRMQRVLPHMRLILGLGFTPVSTQYQKVTLKFRKKKTVFQSKSRQKKIKADKKKISHVAGARCYTFNIKRGNITCE